MKILWIIPKWTLPAIDGARVATQRLVRSTILAGAQVDILCLAQENEVVDIKYSTSQQFYSGYIQGKIKFYSTKQIDKYTHLITKNTLEKISAQKA